MEEIFIKGFTIYGPLALGWIAWWFERKDNNANQVKLMEIYATTAGTLAALRQLFEDRLPGKK